jgi:DNA mismatch endonuclease (patch repair protein)
VFVDGCFWHGCPRHGTLPKGNARFWREKIARNREREREVDRELRRRGWRVLRIREHELRRTTEARVVGRLRRKLPAPA